MDKADRVLVTQLPALVDHFLTATFHLRVFTLYRSEVQIFRTCTGRHRRRRAATQTDQHGRATQNDQFSANFNFAFLNVVSTDITHTTGQHDRLVVTPHLVAVHTGRFLFKRTEVTVQVRTTKFVVKCGTTQRTFDHDIQRRNDTLRLTISAFPRLVELRDVQVRDGETGQTCFWLGTTAGSTFVTDLTTGACRCTRERRNRSRVVMGFHLHQQVNRLVVLRVFFSLRIREEAVRFMTHNHRGVVFISRKNIRRALLIGVLDHAEQRFLLLLAINGPAGVEDLVTAVLRVRLCKHHQLNVIRVTTQIDETLYQIIDLIVCQCQTQRLVRLFQSRTATAQNIHRSQRTGFFMAEQTRSLIQIGQNRLSHAVMQQTFNNRQICS